MSLHYTAHTTCTFSLLSKTVSCHKEDLAYAKSIEAGRSARRIVAEYMITIVTGVNFDSILALVAGCLRRRGGLRPAVEGWAEIVQEFVALGIQGELIRLDDRIYRVG